MRKQETSMNNQDNEGAGLEWALNKILNYYNGYGQRKSFPEFRLSQQPAESPLPEQTGIGETLNRDEKMEQFEE
jgi:hypothetical protein